MIKRNQKFINALNLLSDALLIMLAYPAAVFLRFRVLRGQESVPLLSMRMMLAVAGCSAFIVLLYSIFRLYGYDRLRRKREEGLRILLVNGVGMLVFIAVCYTVRLVDFSRLALVFFWLFSSILVIAKRAAVRALLAVWRRRGYNLKHVIIIGCGHLADQYVQDVGRNPFLGYSITGYIGDVQRPALGERLGSYREMEEILARHMPDEVVIALDPQDIYLMPDIMQAADKEGVRLSLIPFFNDYIPRTSSISVLNRTRLLDLRVTPLDHPAWALVKRTMDVAGSLLLIVLTSPLMLAIAVGVRLTSPGPVIFCQERVGRNRKPFKMLKFRSMIPSDTEDTGWSKPDDPRTTRFGSFIRRFSLDELPQFFNCLKGDMSLVGPRPEMPFHVKRFKEEIPLYQLRQQVRPGMTGWAQVNGLRGDTSIEERVRHDLWYIENWSIALDLKILFRTVAGGMVNRKETEK